MALVTAARSVEKGFTLLLVTRKCVKEKVGAAMIRRISLHMQPRDDIGNLVLCHVRLWQTLGLVAIPNHGAYQEAFFVIQHQQRSHQVRCPICALSGGSMTSATLGHKQRASARHR